MKIAALRTARQPPLNAVPGTNSVWIRAALHLGDSPDLSRLIRAYKEPPRLVKSETCRSETIIVPYIVLHLPAFVHVDVAHDVDDCRLAVRRRYWPSVGKIKLEDFVARGTITIPKLGETVSPICTLEMGS